MNKKDLLNYHCSDVRNKLSTFLKCDCVIERSANAFLYTISHPSSKTKKLEVYFPFKGSQLYRIKGKKSWKSYKRADLLVKDTFKFNLSDKQQDKYHGFIDLYGHSQDYYLVGKTAFKTKEAIKKYAGGQLKYAMMNAATVDEAGIEFFQALALSAGQDYPGRVVGKVLKVRLNEFGTGLELYDAEDPEIVGGISYHKMITLIPTDSKVYLNKDWEALELISI